MTTAANGKLALELLKTKEYDVVLIDFLMPVREPACLFTLLWGPCRFSLHFAPFHFILLLCMVCCR